MTACHPRNHDYRKGGLRHYGVSAPSVARHGRGDEFSPIHDAPVDVDVGILRDEWLEHGLSTEPADRSTAESAVSELYRFAGKHSPEFVWAPSPLAATSLIEARGSVSAHDLGGCDFESASARIASVLSASRSRMDGKIERREPALHLSGRANRRAVHGFSGTSLAIRQSLRTSLFDGAATAIRTLLPPAIRGVPWYGQQEAHRVAHYDVYRRYRGVRFRVVDHELLDLQCALTRATGWWWAFDDICILADRPRMASTEAIPGGLQNERRVHRSGAPAIEFSDGSAVFAEHGTIVPPWVILDPSVERIAVERNVEIRRVAIERIGWDVYIDKAGLDLIDFCDDPGNPGRTLELYATPDGWGRAGRILLTVNGSVERDGSRRRYGLHVPHWIDTALNAAGWTYGLSGDNYSQLVRRT